MVKDREPKAKILLIIEDIGLQDYVSLILMGEGYPIQIYGSQDDLLNNINKESFDLVIVDFSSPHIDGLKVCKIIRESFPIRFTPVIMLLPAKDSLIKAKVIYSGADDYLEKSLLSEELLLRVKAALWRVYRYQDINPLTKLPGISTAIKELREKIESKELFAVGYAELFQFRRFNDRYGFKRGDEIIVQTAMLIRQALVKFGSPYDFLAHFGGDDFIFITLPDSADPLCKKIIKDFDDAILSFYDKKDIERGCILVKNRKGEISSYPFLRISIGLVTNEYYALTSTAQIIQITTELKDYAKKFEKSMYVKERRKSYPFY